MYRGENMEGDIIFNIDVMLAKRKMSVTELADRVGITITNMSILKTGKAKAIKVSTLAKLCAVLECQPGDLLEFRENPNASAEEEDDE
jgi:putative transcriptional regulator